VHIFKEEDSKTNKDPTRDDIGLNYINQTLSIHLSVVKSVSSPPAEKDNWRKSVTFHTFIKIRDKSCKVIVDSKSYIYAISSKWLEYLGLEVVPHPHLKCLRLKCLRLTPHHLRSNVLSKSISIITKTISGVM